MPQSSGRRRTSIGVLFWIAFILLVLVIFLANRSNIEQVLDTTGLLDVLRDRYVDVDRSPVEPEPPAPTRQPELQPRLLTEDRPPATREPQPEPAPPSPRPAPAPTPQPAPAPVQPRSEPAPMPEPRTQPAQRAPSPDPAKPNRLMAGLYYIRVTEDGRTYPQRVVRPVYYDSSPLTETIRTLISGPTGEELNNGLLNLIPDGTELISAHVRNGTAFLNFNQAFRFNPLGAEGTVAQLLQIIYSSTEFPTVERVQFLLEGEQLEYLGGDGIYVGEPLGRNAFSS